MDSYNPDQTLLKGNPAAEMVEFRGGGFVNQEGGAPPIIGVNEDIFLSKLGIISNLEARLSKRSINNDLLQKFVNSFVNITGTTNNEKAKSIIGDIYRTSNNFTNFSFIINPELPLTMGLVKYFTDNIAVIQKLPEWNIYKDKTPVSVEPAPSTGATPSAAAAATPGTGATPSAAAAVAAAAAEEEARAAAAENIEEMPRIKKPTIKELLAGTTAAQATKLDASNDVAEAIFLANIASNIANAVYVMATNYNNLEYNFDNAKSGIDTLITDINPDTRAAVKSGITDTTALSALAKKHQERITELLEDINISLSEIQKLPDSEIKNALIKIYNYAIYAITYAQNAAVATTSEEVSTLTTFVEAITGQVISYTRSLIQVIHMAKIAAAAAAAAGAGEEAQTPAGAAGLDGGARRTLKRKNGNKH